MLIGRKEYVLGFMFDYSRHRVLLIEKQHPEWQRGLLNGIGGKINPDELPVNAMVREFAEETGIETSAVQWQQKMYMSGTGLTTGDGQWVCTVFTTEGDIDTAQQTTDERPLVYDVTDATFAMAPTGISPAIAHIPIMPNLRWIIPFLLDSEPVTAVAVYA